MNKKTKFSDLIKLKKRNLEQLEKELQIEFGRVRKSEKEIALLEQEILEIDYPTSGNFAMLQQFNIAMHNMKGDIGKIREEKLASLDRIGEIQKKMVEANMEVEKYQYLENEILKKRKYEIEKEESKRLDEVATILFTNKRK